MPLLLQTKNSPRQRDKNRISFRSCSTYVTHTRALNSPHDSPRAGHDPTPGSSGHPPGALGCGMHGKWARGCGGARAGAPHPSPPREWPGVRASRRRLGSAQRPAAAAGAAAGLLPTQRRKKKIHPPAIPPYHGISHSTNATWGYHLPGTCTSPHFDFSPPQMLSPVTEQRQSGQGVRVAHHMRVLP